MNIFYIYTTLSTSRASKACQAFLGFAKIYLNSCYLVSFCLLFLKTKYNCLFFMTIHVAINLLAFLFLFFTLGGTIGSKKKKIRSNLGKIKYFRSICINWLSFRAALFFKKKKKKKENKTKNKLLLILADIILAASFKDDLSCAFLPWKTPPKQNTLFLCFWCLWIHWNHNFYFHYHWNSFQV